MSDQGISPQPQPTVWGFDHTVDGRFVVLVSHTHGGTRVDFISTENATAIWQAIREQAKQAKRKLYGDSGIEVPPKPILGPDGNVLHIVPPSDEVIQAKVDAATKAEGSEE